jgi:hypothetical protein
MRDNAAADEVLNNASGPEVEGENDSNTAATPSVLSVSLAKRTKSFQPHKRRISSARATAGSDSEIPSRPARRLRPLPLQAPTESPEGRLARERAERELEASRTGRKRYATPRSRT